LIDHAYAYVALHGCNKGGAFILRDTNFLQENGGLGFADILRLKDLGVISSNDVAIKMFSDQSTKRELISVGDHLLLIDRAELGGSRQIGAQKLSHLGVELIDLLPKRSNFDYMRLLGSHFVSVKAEVSIAKINYFFGDGQLNYSVMEKLGDAGK
jgi:hypothetical protein